ncbi:hypothetical protein PAMP_004406 [Pampus punctatissimus]
MMQTQVVVPQFFCHLRAVLKVTVRVMDELQRILDKDNSKFISEVKKRWADFCSMVQFYGVWRKVLKSPMSLGTVESNIALYRALPTLFPSQSAPPKKMGQASETLLHVLQPTEEPAIYLQKRTLFSPVLVFDGSRCLLAIGNTPVTTFAKEELGKGLLYLMGYYYTMHLTYPVCGDPSLCHSDRCLTGQYPRARHHRLVQKSHGRVECFH